MANKQIKDLGTIKTVVDDTDKVAIQEVGNTTRNATIGDIRKSYKRMGFMDYNDLATATTPITVTGGVGFVNLTNDELGAFTNKTYLPTGITDVWNASTNLFDFTQLPLGTKVDYRLDLEVTTTSANQDIDVDIELAVGGSAYTISVDHQAYKSVGTYPIVRSSYIYMGDSNTRDNGARFRIKSDSNATVKVNGWACYVHLYE